MFNNFPFDPFDVVLTDTEFLVKFKPLSRKPLSWLEELTLATKKYKAIPKTLYVGMSGGLDSEIIATMFLKEQIEFIPLIIEYHHNGSVLNHHDIQYAKDFCKKNNIVPLIHQVKATTLIDMASDEKYFPYYRVVALYQYQQIYLVNLVESLGGFLVTGSGIQTWTYDRELKFKLHSVFLNVYEYMNDHNFVHWPSFYWTTPELIRSYIETPAVKQMFAQPMKFKVRYTSEYVKQQVYHDNFPDLIPRKKYHGFEKFDVVPEYRNLINRVLNYENSTTKITYNNFIFQFDQLINDCATQTDNLHK